MNIDTSKFTFWQKWWAAVVVWVLTFYVVTGIQYSEGRWFFWCLTLSVSFLGIIISRSRRLEKEEKQ